MANPRFIPCEDGSYVLVQNVTRLSVSTDYDDKSRIMVHTIGPAMPFKVASFETQANARYWLRDLIDRLEANGNGEQKREAGNGKS